MIEGGNACLSGHGRTASTSISTFQRGSKRRGEHGRVRRADVAEDLGVRAGEAVEVVGVDEVDARAHDVLEARPRLLQRGADELEADVRLVVDVLGRRRAVGRVRRRPGDVHAVAGDDGARVADDRLVRARPRDVSPLHGATSIAARAGASPDRRLAGRVRGRRCRRSGRRRGDARRRGARRFGSRRCRSRSPRSRRSSPPRRASSTSTSRPARPARPFATCSRTRRAFRSRARTPIARPGHRRIYSNEAFRVLAEHLPSARRCRSSRLRARRRLRAARDRPRPERRPRLRDARVARRRARDRSRAARAARSSPTRRATR